MFEDLKENEPKTYIIISLAFVMVVVISIGVMLYLTAITRYIDIGAHIVFAIVGGGLCFLGVIWIINIMGHVSKLKTKMDIEEQEKRAEAKLKWQLKNKRMEILLKKLDKDELTLVDQQEIEEIRKIELEPIQGGQSG